MFNANDQSSDTSSVVQEIVDRGDYQSGSQAVIVYSAGPRDADRGWAEVTSGSRSAEIDAYRAITLRGAVNTDVRKYKPEDKGHRVEYVASREAIEGRRDGDEFSRSAFATSRVALADIESMATGQPISLDRS